VNEIQKELSRIQKQLKAPKNQYNAFGKYKYRSAEDILEGVKAVIKDCAVTVSDEVVMIGHRFYVKATATLKLGDQSISVTAMAREAENKKGMDEPQVTGAASSYAKKYALNGLFAIDDTKDPDTKPPKDNEGPCKNDLINKVLEILKQMTEGQTPDAKKAFILELGYSNFAEISKLEAQELEALIATLLRLSARGVE
jgi:hypothetical protein